MKKKIIGGAILLCSLLLSGCFPAIETIRPEISAFSKLTASACESVFSELMTSVWGEKNHDCELTITNKNGQTVYCSKEKADLEYFADLVSRLEESEISFNAPAEKAFFCYTTRDNDNIVLFQLYETEELLSCEVGPIRVYYPLSPDLKEAFMHPENWNN